MLNGVACCLRALLSVDPISTYDRYSVITSQVVLLRLPQLLWVTAVVNLAFVWSFVAKSFQYRLDDLQSKSRRVYLVLLL